MKISVDTNVLLRILVPGDALQQKIAVEVLEAADQVMVSIHTLCELAWVMERSYKAPRHEIAVAIRRLSSMRNVIMNRPAVQAGLQLLDAGGDFADGAIVYEGQSLGGEIFVSFDRKAVRLVTAQGHAARLLQ